MGHKVSPIGMRVGVIRDWESRWYADKEYGNLLTEDVKIRNYLYSQLTGAAVSRIEIERTKNQVQIAIRSARPGVIIGTNGEKIEQMKKYLVKMTNGKKINLKVVEIANPDLDAYLVAQSIAEQLEARASFRTTQKRAIQKTMRAGAKGIKTVVSGRLGGADIARKEGYSEGIVPLHTLREDIDYALCEAKTTYGHLGVKVWICRGEVKRGEMVKEPEAPKMAPRNDRRRDNRDGRRPNGNRNFRSANPTAVKPAETQPAAETAASQEVAQHVDA